MSTSFISSSGTIGLSAAAFAAFYGYFGGVGAFAIPEAIYETYADVVPVAAAAEASFAFFFSLADICQTSFCRLTICSKLSPGLIIETSLRRPSSKM